jgi:hypothetical protein
MQTMKAGLLQLGYSLKNSLNLDDAQVAVALDGIKQDLARQMIYIPGEHQSPPDSQPSVVVFRPRTPTPSEARWGHLVQALQTTVAAAQKDIETLQRLVRQAEQQRQADLAESQVHQTLQGGPSSGSMTPAPDMPHQPADLQSTTGSPSQTPAAPTPQK